MHGSGGHAWQLACMVGGQGVGVAGGMHAWQKRRPLQRMVYILFESILVLFVSVLVQKST